MIIVLSGQSPIDNVRVIAIQVPVDKRITATGPRRGSMQRCTSSKARSVMQKVIARRVQVPFGIAEG